ncbi:MAG: hypothetical protein ACRD3W_28260 [Terriglobales bacterium]
MSDHTKQEGSCPLTTALGLASDSAKKALGTEGGNKRVTSTAKLSTAVTENGKTKTTSVDAGVTLGTNESEVDAPADCCCAASGGAGCCCKPAATK